MEKETHTPCSISDEDISDMEICTPDEISEKAKEVSLNLLPTKSKDRYDIQYKLFRDWCATKKVKKYSENVILTYLSELSEKYKSSSLWSIHSMLKTSLLVRHNINIKTYIKVNAFLKKQSVGYVPIKSKIFDHQEIELFLIAAPNEIYLMMKVALIIGIAGACRTDELTNMTIDNVVDKDEILVINILNTKNNKQRIFTVSNFQKENCINTVSICKKYFSLRPKNITSRRLFIKYTNGKCAAQNVGHHTIGSIPCKIATYLKLENPKEYTGHCYRRTSATLLADSGADILTIKRHGGWKANKILNTETIITQPNPVKGYQAIDESDIINSSSITNDSPGTTSALPSLSMFTENFPLANSSKHGPSLFINNYLLILEVERRPELYNNTTNSPEVIERLWYDVAEALLEAFNSLSEEEQADKVLKVKTKWKELRADFKKQIKAYQNGECMVEAQNLLYFDELKFLVKYLDTPDFEYLNVKTVQPRRSHRIAVGNSSYKRGHVEGISDPDMETEIDCQLQEIITPKLEEVMDIETLSVKCSNFSPEELRAAQLNPDLDDTISSTSMETPNYIQHNLNLDPLLISIENEMIPKLEEVCDIEDVTIKHEQLSPNTSRTPQLSPNNLDLTNHVSSQLQIVQNENHNLVLNHVLPIPPQILQNNKEKNSHKRAEQLQNENVPSIECQKEIINTPTKSVRLSNSDMNLTRNNLQQSTTPISNNMRTTISTEPAQQISPVNNLLSNTVQTPSVESQDAIELDNLFLEYVASKYRNLKNDGIKRKFRSLINQAITQISKEDCNM